MSELKNKAIKGVGWSFADNLLSQGVTFLVGIVLARLLSPEEYGLIGIITIFISVFNAIVDSGFSNALIRKTDATDADYNTAFYTNLVVSVVLALAMFACAPLIASFFSQPKLAPLTEAMSCIVVINALAIVQRTLLVKAIDFKTQTKISFLSSLISAAGGIGSALAGLGVWALVIQQISRQFFNTLFLWCYSRWRPAWQYSADSFRYLFGFGWKLMLSCLLATLWNEIYQVVIGRCYSAASLGLYTRAQQFSSIPSSNISGVVQRVSYPALSSIKDDPYRLKQAYRRVVKTTMLLNFVVTLGLAATAKPLIYVLLGEKWVGCVPMLQIVCFSIMLHPLHSLNLNVLEVKGRSDLFLRLEIYKRFIGLGPVLMGIFVGIYWMLITSVVTGVISLYLNAYYSGPLLGYPIKEQARDISASFLIALAMLALLVPMTFLPVSSYIILPAQIAIGAWFVITLCRRLKLEEYEEMVQMIASFKTKITHKA